MLKKKKCIFTLIILYVIIFQNINAITIGSDSDVDRFSTQQTLSDGDRVAYFASLEGGFKINSSSSSVIFDSTFEVSGQVDMNLATVTLLQDIIFANDTTWLNIGNIYGNNHKICICPTIKTVPYNANNDQQMYLIANKIQTDNVVSVDWSYDNTFVAIGVYSNGGSHNTLAIYKFDGVQLIFKDSVNISNMTVHDVAWHPSSHLLAAVIQDANYDLFLYEVNNTTGALAFKSQAYLTGNGHSVDWHPSGNYIAVGRTKSTEEISIFSVDNSGIVSSTAIYSIDLSPDRSPSTEAICWNNTGDYLAVGTTNAISSSSEAQFLIYAFSSETLTLNASLDFDTDVTAVSWNKVHTDILAVGLSDTNNKIRIYEHNKAIGTITEKNSINTSATVKNLHWSPSGRYLVVAKKVSAEYELEVYQYNNTDHTLVQKIGFHFADEVESVRFSPDENYIAVGTQTRELLVYSSYQELPSINSATFDNINLCLNANLLCKKSRITFNGNSSINGNGHKLTMDPDCTFIVGKDATLTLKNIIIENINDNNIDCINSESTLKLNNTQLILDNNYTFTMGTLHIYGNTHIIGPGKTFSYQSPTTSFIEDNSTLILGNNLIFDYNPPILNNQLINLINNNSKIILDGATLHASYGLKLTKGMLEIKRNATLSTDGITESKSIILGDGSDSSNNITIHMRPGNKLHITSGNIINKNV